MRTISRIAQMLVVLIGIVLSLIVVLALSPVLSLAIRWVVIARRGVPLVLPVQHHQTNLLFLRVGLWMSYVGCYIVR
jgi:hypothetical protein